MRRPLRSPTDNRTLRHDRRVPLRHGAEPEGVGGERLHEWIYDLESWREVRGLDGGKSGRDDEIVPE